MMNQRGQVTDLCCVYNWSLDLGVCNNETVNLIYIISLWNDQVMKGADMLFLLLYFIEIPMLEWWLYFDYDVLLYYLKVLLSLYSFWRFMTSAMKRFTYAGIFLGFQI